jgi:hypothetical protein
MSLNHPSMDLLSADIKKILFSSRSSPAVEGSGMQAGMSSDLK